MAINGCIHQCFLAMMETAISDFVFGLLELAFIYFLFYASFIAFDWLSTMLTNRFVNEIRESNKR